MAVPKVAFVSGPLDATDEYFEEHYRGRIDVAIRDGHHFVMGPVIGIDTMALEYMLSHEVSPARITVYMAYFEFANATLLHHFEDLGVNTKRVGELMATTRDRDAKMTEDSDYDILRYRTEAEAKALYGKGWWPRVSNTEMNERRRKGITSQAYNLSEHEGQGEEKAKSSIKDQLLGMFKRG